jgi:hypothetical protein
VVLMRSAWTRLAAFAPAVTALGCPLAAEDDYYIDPAVTAAGAEDSGACSPTTCAAKGAKCGTISDGCGQTLMCGNCGSMQACGAVTPNQCGTGQCTPKTCQGLGLNCGDVTDGCGGTLHCGMCPANEKCGVGGVPNLCACVPKKCDQLGAQCGTVGDGCTGMLDCGVCAPGKACGAKQPNHCDDAVDAGH